MRLKVENIKLKNIITEATYKDAFAKIKNGDIITIKTGKEVYKVEVINKFSNEIIFKYNNLYYMITDNSFRGDTLETRRLIVGQDGKTKTTIKGPTLKGIYNITVTRNGQPVTGVTPDKGRTKPEGVKQSKQKNIFKERYQDIQKELKLFNENDRMLIVTGKIITKGRDKGSLAKNTITEIELEVVKKTKNGTLKGKIIEISGADKDKYERLKNQYLFIGPESVIITNEGLTMVVKTITNGTPSKKYIKNVFSIENKGVDIDSKEKELSNKDVWDFIQKTPHLRKAIYQKPSLIGKIFGKKTTYNPLALKSFFDAAHDLGDYKKGDKIKFIYYGNPIMITKDIDLENGKKYIGKYDGEGSIILKSSNRKDYLELKIVGSKTDKKVAKLIYKSTRFNKLTEKDLGNVIIDIL